MIRKRARGIKDTEYFKLKIRQVSTKDEGDMFYIDDKVKNDEVYLKNAA